MLHFIKHLSNYKRLVLKEIVFQLFEKGIRIIIGLIVINQMAVYLGPGLFGIYNYVESYYLIILGLSTFGLDVTITKLLSRKENINSIIENGIILLFFFGLIFIVISCLIIYFFLNDEKNFLLLIVTSILLLNPIYVFEYYFISKNQIRISSSFKIISYIIKSGLILYAVYNELSLIYFVSIILFEALIYSLLITIYFMFNPLNIKLKIDKKLINKMISSSSFIFLYSIGAIIYNRIDIIMIEKFLSNDDLGFYSASFKLLTFFYFIPTILSQTFFPKIVELANLNDNNSKSLSIIYKLNFLSALIIFFGLIFFGDSMIYYLFGEDFSKSNTILYILSFNIILTSVGSSYAKVLYSNNLEKRLFIKMIFGLLINILLNFILIKLYGVYGVAFATAIALFFIEVIYDFFDMKLIRFHVFKMKSILLFFKND